ncbi:MAG: DNA double-strand break repair nuclease NurA [Chloroflexi bacterium]|nr:DNA double-strand break repair nuclease NurA [Chloroflexota bacterium]
MSLDLHQTALQIDAMAEQLVARQAEHGARLREALATLESADPVALEARRREGHITWLAAALTGGLGGRYSAPGLPQDYAVLAVDGSHIAVDRHSPARCLLINIGRVLLRYGQTPEARLESTPRLHVAEDELAIEDPDGFHDQQVEGPVLGMVRAVEEARALADLARQVAADVPAVALMDGSLILWGLAGQTYPEFLRRRLLQEGFLDALEELRQMALRRVLAVASYVSLPRSADVVSALRLAVCPYPIVNCDRHCKGLHNGQRPCDRVGGLTDRDLFARVLEPGQRSDLFVSASSIVESYGEHAPHFFYVHGGQEIGRVELPAWAAKDEALLGLVHAAVVEQCQKGHGYPVALSESHEQAVVTGQDREHFALLVEEALAGRRLPVSTSEKARSKRTRFV